MNRRFALGLFFVSIVGACSGQGTSCAGLSPLPQGTTWHLSDKVNNPVQARISPAGLSYLNQNYQSIVSLLAPGQTMTVPVDCTVQSIFIGDVLIADQGSAGCLTESCGLMDGKCDSQDVPAQVPITITNLQLQPSPPSSIKASVTLQLHTGQLYVDSVSRSSAVCFLSGGGPLKCGVDFDTTRALPTDQTIIATLEFYVETPFSERLQVKLDAVDGLKACGTSGALPSPSCTDANDLLITPQATGCCPAGNSSTIKDVLLSFLATQLKDQIQSKLDQATCEPCGVGNSCPVEEDGGVNTCDTSRGLCMNSAIGRCTPIKMGVEGRLDPATLLNPNATSNSKVDLSLVAGHSASVDTGINVSTRGGAHAVQQADCVPAIPVPAPEIVDPVDFDGASDGGYHLGISISRAFLDRAGYELHQAGALCGRLDTYSVSQLNSGLLRPFLPSLGLILGPKDVPMMAVIRPQNPPTFTVRAGTFDSTGAIVEPLLLLNLKDFAVDFYVQLDDRYARLFTAVLDVALPISLEPDGCGAVLPVLGDLSKVASNVRFTNSDILAEDVSALAPFVPAVVSLATPAIASNLTAFSLPQFGSFGIDVVEVKGVHPAAAAGTFDDAAIYAKLVDASSCVPPPPVPVSAALDSVNAPIGDALQRGERPFAKLKLSASGPIFASYRVDQDLPSAFVQVPESGELRIDSPALLMQGRHTVQLLVRKGDGHFSTRLEPVSFTVDLEAPQVSLVAQGDEVVTVGQDSLTPADALRYSYALGAGAFGEPGPAKRFSLSAIDAAGGLQVRAYDSAGHEAQASFRAATVALRSDAPEPASRGCSVGFGLFPALSLLAVRLSRRRR